MKTKSHLARSPRLLRPQSKGFTLIEVLIAMTIVAIGLLGQMQMQIETISTNKIALYKAQSAYLASELVDRMRLNIPGVDNGLYDDISTIDDPDDPDDDYATNACITSTDGCTVEEIAGQDIFEWVESIKAVIPSGTATVNRLDAITDQAAFEIIVSWQGKYTHTSSTDAQEYNSFTMQFGI